MNEIDLMVALAECEVELNELKDRAKKLPLTEGIDAAMLDTMFDETSKMLDAARRGLGLTNKLKDSALRTTARSRIMGNLNRIRAKLSRITKALGSYDTTSKLSEDHPALKFQLATKKADKILKTINSVRDEGQYQVATKYAQLFMKKTGKHDFINKELNTALQAKAKALNINSNSVSSMTEA